MRSKFSTLVLSLIAGLFHKAIMHSGVALNPWAFHPEPEKRAYQLCKLLGHEGKDPKSAVEFLRTVDIQKLIDAQEKLRTKDVIAYFRFLLIYNSSVVAAVLEYIYFYFSFVAGKNQIYVHIWPEYRFQI